MMRVYVVVGDHDVRTVDLVVSDGTAYCKAGVVHVGRRLQDYRLSAFDLTQRDKPVQLV